MRQALVGFTFALAAAAAAADASADENHLRASDLLEMQVLGADGEYFGAISDLLLDGKGAVSDLVVRAGDPLGMGERRYVVPWSRVRIESTQKSVVMDVAANRLAAEFPVFDARATGAGGAGGERRQ